MKRDFLFVVLIFLFVSCFDKKNNTSIKNDDFDVIENNNGVNITSYEMTNGTSKYKKNTPYLDDNFLGDVLKIDDLKIIKPSDNWPNLLDNTFLMETDVGDIRMIHPDYLFDFAKKMQIDEEYYHSINEDEEYYRKLVGAYYEKGANGNFIRAIYFNEENVNPPDPVNIRYDLINKIDRIWYLNENQYDQKIYNIIDGKSGNEIVEINYNGFCDEPSQYGSFLKKRYSNLFFLHNKDFAFISSLDMRLTSYDESDNSGSPSQKALVSESERTWIHIGELYNWSDLVRSQTQYKSGRYSPVFYPKNNRLTLIGKLFSIQCSEPLIESRRPFIYTIDKSFDGNFSTSYVENTKDDLMEFEFLFYKDLIIKGFAFVNGYAENRDIYLKNNRIKTVKIISEDKESPYEKSFDLEDNDLNYQVFNCTPNKFYKLKIMVTNIYPGSKFNDTCLAEINILTDNGWLFNTGLEGN